jgi:hypothetical protein
MKNENETMDTDIKKQDSNNKLVPDGGKNDKDKDKGIGKK